MVTDVLTPYFGFKDNAPKMTLSVKVIDESVLPDVCKLDQHLHRVSALNDEKGRLSYHMVRTQKMSIMT